MSRKHGAKPPGQIRQSQVVTTFGPGAMVDLPKHSVLVTGLDYWSKGGEEIVEPRMTPQARHRARGPVDPTLHAPTSARRPVGPVNRDRLLPVP
jgi:hypothetical protein